MRLFVAVNLPEAERQRLHQATASLRSAAMPVRWTEPEALHLTLKFLGEVAESQAEAVASVLGTVAAAHAPFSFELGGVGAFPNVRDPRVVWVGTRPAPELLRLQQDVERGLTSLDFEPEARPFSAHLTIGRARRWAQAKDFRDFQRLAGSVLYRSTVTVTSVDLMRSHLSSAGARYERIVAAPLTVSHGK
jgi:2'-5' RNA ligase